METEEKKASLLHLRYPFDEMSQAKQMLKFGNQSTRGRRITQLRQLFCKQFAQLFHVIKIAKCNNTISVTLASIWSLKCL